MRTMSSTWPSNQYAQFRKDPVEERARKAEAAFIRNYFLSKASKGLSAFQAEDATTKPTLTPQPAQTPLPARAAPVIDYLPAFITKPKTVLVHLCVCTCKKKFDMSDTDFLLLQEKNEEIRKGNMEKKRKKLPMTPEEKPICPDCAKPSTA